MSMFPAVRDDARHVAEALPSPIRIGAEPFDPWQVRAVEHELCGHPLLQRSALVELGKRLEARKSIRTHTSSATAGTPFNNAPDLHPNTAGATATISAIESANAWMSLLNVQADPQYRRLVDEVLDGVRPWIDRADPGMSYRGGWIFVTSPGVVTPFHFDKEHNFILQLQGRKRVYVWDPTDTVVASEEARDAFHRHHSRDLLCWRASFLERAHVFDLKPGQGAYMPSTSPHMVENGDEGSITISFTYYSRSTRRDALLHTAHHLMRRAGLPPPPVGAFPLLDGATHLLAAPAAWVARHALHMAGRKVRMPNARYAAE